MKQFIYTNIKMYSPKLVHKLKKKTTYKLNRIEYNTYKIVQRI